MKKIILRTLWICPLIMGLSLTSCKKDEDPEPEPTDNSSNQNGNEEVYVSYLVIDNMDTIPFKSHTRSYSDSTRTIYQSNFEKGDTLISLVYTTISVWDDTKTYVTKNEGIVYDPAVTAKEDTMHIALNDFSGPWNDADSQIGQSITITKAANQKFDISFDNMKFKQQWGDETLINLTGRIVN